MTDFTVNEAEDGSQPLSLYRWGDIDQMNNDAEAETLEMIARSFREKKPEWSPPSLKTEPEDTRAEPTHDDAGVWRVQVQVCILLYHQFCAKLCCRRVLSETSSSPFYRRISQIPALEFSPPLQEMRFEVPSTSKL